MFIGAMQQDFQDALRRVDGSFQSWNQSLRSRFDGTTDGEGINLSASLTELRQACLTLLQVDLQRASNEGIDGRLWAAHTSTNDRYRVLLRKINKKKEVVRWRVHAAEYKNFIKESQIFYRQYTRWLSEYGGIKVLHQIAQNWRKGTIDEDAIDPHDASVEHLVDIRDLATTISHDCLLRLGDLSRWRYSTRVDGERGQPRDAVGYYELAEIIRPESGAAQNQLAVLAAGDKHSFRALYHFYRSLAHEQPHELALQNLDLEFKKIRNFSDEELIRSSMPSDHNQSVARLRTWFIRFLAGLHTGAIFPQQDELESEIIGRISHGLSRGDAHNSTIERMILMGICAGWQARSQQATHPTPEHDRTYVSYVRFNLRAFLTLLQQAETALDESFREELATDGGHKNPADDLTKFARQCLKLLHPECFWLTARAVDISKALETSTDPSIALLAQDVWRAFVAVLNYLVENFEVNKVEALDYLSHEEELCLGLEPVLSDHTEQSWYVEGKLKPRASEWKQPSDDEGAERSRQTLETLARVRDIVTMGVRLAVSEEVPQISLDGQRFKYDDPTIPTGMLANEPADQREGDIAAGAESILHPVQSNTASAIEPFEGTIDLNEMVENLLDDPLEPVDRMPETPHMTNFDDAAKISNSIQSLRLDGFEKSAFGSPSMSKPRIPTPDRRDYFPSSFLPSVPFYANRPSYYGNDETWQSRPASGPAYPGGGWLPQNHPNSSKETQRPNSRNRTDVIWGHSHHSSLPGFAADSEQHFSGLPMSSQMSAAIQGSPSMTGFNYTVNTPSPTMDHGRFVHGPPPRLAYNPIDRNCNSSSHVPESSEPHSPRLPSSWNKTPPNGQGD